MRSYSKELGNFIELVKSGDYVVLDTETTGLHWGEIVEIAIVNSSGDTLLNQLVKPVEGIPFDATRIHGITDEDVAGAPGWVEVSQKVLAHLMGANVIVYNATYDLKMMHQSAEAAGMDKINWVNVATWRCAMRNYAEFFGDWDDYHNSYTWQRLTVACFQQDLPAKDAHRALGDCLMTLALCKKMAGVS